MRKTSDIDFWYLQVLTYAFAYLEPQPFVQTESSVHHNSLLHFHTRKIFCPMVENFLKIFSVSVLLKLNTTYIYKDMGITP